jgi:hypothetical protein
MTMAYAVHVDLPNLHTRKNNNKHASINNIDAFAIHRQESHQPPATIKDSIPAHQR